MSRRTRALGFTVAAALCAGLAASSTGGGTDAGAEYGALREVVVAATALPAGRKLRAEVVRRALELRRVPESFVPPDALVSVDQAVRRTPVAEIAAGGYVLNSQLQTNPGAGEAPASAQRLGPGRRAVEIAVEAAGAIAGAPGLRRRVDVIVTSEPGPGGGAGRTYIAVRAVKLLELAPAAGGPPNEEILQGPTEAWTATLALTRGESLSLIHAESFARSVRLIES